MNVGEFLNASAAAGADGCAIMPRVSLYEYLDKKNTLLETTRSLLDLPVYPKMSILGLDNWANFASVVNRTVIASVLASLHEQGWQTLAVNNVGGYHSAEGLASMADFGTKIGDDGASGAQPNWKQLSKLNNDTSISTKLLYIDFPAQMREFLNRSTPDEMAAAIVDRLANNTLQKQKKYSFVYPFIQTFWDSSELRTSPSGRFEGKTVYKVMCENIRSAVADRPLGDMPPCSLY